MDIQIKGFFRLEQVLELIPVRKSCWYEGIRTGRFPAPVKLGRMSLWKVEDIERLVAEIENGSFA